MTGTDNVSIDFERAAFSIDEIDGTLDPIAGARKIAVLDPSMRAGFVEMANVEQDIAALSEALRRRLLVRQADTLADSDLDDFGALSEALAKAQLFETEAEAIFVFQVFAEFEELRATFWRSVRMQYNVWNEWLEIRSGFTLVSIGKKYTPA